MRSIYIGAVLLLVLSCSRRQGLEKEMPLFINGAAEKLWLFNSITKDTQGKDLHMCALVVYDTLKTGSTISCFTSVWSQKDSSYCFWKKSSQNTNLTSDNKFPIVFSTQQSDSSAGWLWQLNRKKMIWNTTTFAHKTKYHPQYPFPVYKSSDASSFSCVAPITAKTKVSGLKNSKGTTALFINTIDKKEKLISNKNSHHLVWANLKLESGLSFSCLFNVLSDGSSQIQGYTILDSLNKVINDQNIQISGIPSAVWKSNLSGKTYPLGFIITLTNKTELIISPRKQDQELFSKTSSFWMGAVFVLDANKRLQKGSGNMYIFKP
ncbi:MAG: hypothetical protein JNJ41_15990 [Bacteroidia bacterium]|nr:hypothetical protein [Bacteroidia bacterium]